MKVRAEEGRDGAKDEKLDVEGRKRGREKKSDVWMRM